MFIISDNILILNRMSLGPLKQNNASFSPSKEMRKLRIQLADRNFELKKLEQDHAEQKAHLIIQHNQDKNNFQKTIKDLKEKMMDENQQWTRKVDQIRKDRQEKVEAVNHLWKTKFENSLKQIEDKLSKEYKGQIECLKFKLEEERSNGKGERERLEMQIEKGKENSKTKVSKLVEEYEIKMEELRKGMKKEEDIKIKGLMEAKVSEGKRFNEMKWSMKKKQEDCENIIKKYEVDMVAKKEKIVQLKENIYFLEKQNSQLKQNLNALAQSHKRQLSEKEQTHNQKVSTLQKQWKENIQALNLKWKNEHRKIYQANERVQNACNEKERLWEERGKRVLQMYQKREAREEDIKIIQHLEVQLIKKEFELEREKQELKSCKLELDNMDEIYKRIFYSAQKPYKQSSSFHLKRVRLPGLLNKSSHPVKNTLDE